MAYVASGQVTPAGVPGVYTVSKPSGLVADDVVVFAVKDSQLTNFTGVPVGWTFVSNLSRPNAQGTGSWYVYIANGSEGATIGTFTLTAGSGADTALWAHYHGSVSSFGAVQGAGQFTSTNYTDTFTAIVNSPINREIVYVHTGRWYSAGGTGPLDLDYSGGPTRRFQIQGGGGRDTICIADEIVSGGLPLRTVAVTMPGSGAVSTAGARNVLGVSAASGGSTDGWAT